MNRSPHSVSNGTCLEILLCPVRLHHVFALQHAVMHTSCGALVLQNMQLVHHGPGKFVTFLEALFAVQQCTKTSGGKNAALTYFDFEQPRAAWPGAGFVATKSIWLRAAAVLPRAGHPCGIQAVGPEKKATPETRSWAPSSLSSLRDEHDSEEGGGRWEDASVVSGLHRMAMC